MSYRPFLFVLAALISQPILHAQETPTPYDETKGEDALGVNAPDRIDALMLTIPGLGSNSREMLKAQNVKSFMMPPRKMVPGARPETYAATACLEFYTNYRENYKANLSPAFLQLITPTAGLDAALRGLVTSGTVSAAIVPYDARRIPPSASATQIYRLENFLHVVRAEDRAKQKIYQTRKALMRGNPVVLTMRVPPAIRAQRNTRYWTPNGDAATETAAFVVVGFDEDLESFEVLGMWGDEWGHHGYLWIPYADYGRLAEDGYVLLPAGVNL